MSFNKGDRVQVTESASETKLYFNSESIIFPGALGEVVSYDRNSDTCVVHFDRPADAKLPEEEYKYWHIPAQHLKLEVLPLVKGEDYTLRARRNLLAVEYTNATSYNKLGIGLKALIDKLIQTQDILARVIENNKEEKN